MIIIDGHNLLWAVHKLDPESEPIDDLWLCKLLDRYLRQSDLKGHIVFDGTGPPDKSGFEVIQRLDIFYAGMSTDADAVIEDKIYSDSDPRNLTVVSSDRRIRDAARRKKATSLKCDVFWKDVMRHLKQRHKPVEPDYKRRGMTEGEANQWMRFFGFDEESGGQM